MIESIYGIYRSNEQWLQLTGNVFGTWSIFNPNGPTIYCVGATDCGDPDAKSVFLRWLNPFSQGAFALGLFEISNDTWPDQLALILRGIATRDPAAAGWRGFNMLSCIPNIVTMSGHEAIGRAFMSMVHDGLRLRPNDWGRDAAFRSRFGTDLFARAGAEIREALDAIEEETVGKGEAGSESIRFAKIRYSRVPTFVDPTETPYTSQPFSDESFNQWRSQITSDDFVASALKQLAQAWVGSIEVTTLDAIINFESLQGFFSAYNHPLWPKEWTTTMLREAMGLTG